MEKSFTINQKEHDLLKIVIDMTKTHTYIHSFTTDKEQFNAQHRLLKNITILQDRYNETFEKNLTGREFMTLMQKANV